MVRTSRILSQAKQVAQEVLLRGVVILPSITLMTGAVVLLERPDLVVEVVIATLSLGSVVAAIFAQRVLALRRELRNIIGQNSNRSTIPRGDSLVSGVRAFKDRVVQSNPAVPAEQYQPLRGAKVVLGADEEEPTLLIELREARADRNKKIVIH